MAACVPGSRSPDIGDKELLREIHMQKQLAAQDRMAPLERLYRVGMPVLAANASLCGYKVWPYTGLMVESLQGVPESYKDAMHIYYGIENQLTVGFVVPGSPADGKIMPGDRIVGLRGTSIPSGAKGKKIYLETLWNEGRDLGAALPVRVERGRKGTIQDVLLTAPPACLSNIVLELDDTVNAYADRANITFSTGMMRLAAKDELLAMVFAHELAHNVRLHIEAKEMNRVLGDITAIIISSQTGIDLTEAFRDITSGAFSQEFETEADYIGLYMYARAGYDPAKGVELARTLAIHNPASITDKPDNTHPSWARRSVLLRKTAAEIEKKSAAGLPLFPEEKP